MIQRLPTTRFQDSLESRGEVSVFFPCNSVFPISANRGMSDNVLGPCSRAPEVEYCRAECGARARADPSLMVSALSLFPPYPVFFRF